VDCNVDILSLPTEEARDSPRNGYLIHVTSLVTSNLYFRRCSMAPATRSSTLPERSIGKLNKLPPEIRTEIYRHLLSTAYTAISHEQELIGGRNKRSPIRSFDLHPNILRVSKWVNEEANRVLYNENLWVQVAYNPSTTLDDATGLHAHLNRRGVMRYITLPKHRTVITPFQFGLGIKIADNPDGTNLHEGFNKILLPASQLPHFVALLHSLMCSAHQDDSDNFGFRNSIEISVGKLCHLNTNQDQLYDKLLKPFGGLYGLRKQNSRLLNVISKFGFWRLNFIGPTSVSTSGGWKCTTYTKKL